MPRPCSVCASDHRHEVDQALAAGVSVRAIARSHGLSERAVARHRDTHPAQAEVLQARPPDTADGVRPIDRPVEPPKGDSADPGNADPAPRSADPALSGGKSAQSPGGEAAPRRKSAGQGARNRRAIAQSPDNAPPAEPTRTDDRGQGGAVGQRRVPARPGAPAEGPAEAQRPTRTDGLGRLIAGDQRPKFDPSTPEGQRAILQAAGILPKPWPEVEARLEELAEDQRAEAEAARPWLRRPRW